MAKKNYNAPRSLRMDVEPLCMLTSSPVKIGVNSDTELTQVCRSQIARRGIVKNGTSELLYDYEVV